MRALNILFLSIAVAAVQGADIKFGTPNLDAARGRIVVPASSTAKDFAAELARLSDVGNWKLRLRLTDIDVKISADPRTRTIRFDFDPAALSGQTAEQIPKGDLVLTYNRAPVALPVPTGAPGPVSGSAPAPAWQKYFPCWGLALTPEKKDANVDVTGGFQAGVNAKPQYFWSVKAACPVTLGSGAKYGYLAPAFSGEATQQTNADPDSLKAGVVYKKIWAPSGTRNGWIFLADALGYEFERKIKEEAVIVDASIDKRKFLQKNSNLMWSGILRRVYGWRPMNMEFGFLGFDAGKALSRTIKRDQQSEKEQTVARLRFNTDADRTFFYKGVPKLNFHGHYTLRLPFHQEPFSKTDVNKGKMYLTNKPRHWALGELGFIVADGVSINTQYKYGSLPPSFEFVDHQITIGLNVLLKGR